MGPYEVDYVALIIAVLSDFHVIAIAVAVFASWFLLRHVGVVFRSRSRLPRPSGKGAKRPKPGKPEKTEIVEMEE